MSEVIEISTDLIDAEQNNREDFSHVPGLAESIKARGQDQPITVVRKAGGRYLLIAGESRTRACRLLGIPVKAIVREDLSRRDGYMLTLAENDARKETNDLEKALGYRRAIDDHGYTVADIAQHTGKRPDYIERRLNLLTLREDVQKLVKDGQLSIGYANLMVGLDVNRQLIAMRQFRENPSPTVRWFASVCGDLLAQQQQQGLFGWGYGEGVAEQVPAKVVLPPDPARYRPSFSSGNMRQSVADELGKWEEAGAGWAKLGKDNKTESCRAICQVLACWLESLPDVPEVDQAAEKLAGLLAERGTMTTREVLQYANMDAAEAGPVLERMSQAGRITKEKAGRGWRYSLAAVA